VGDARRARRLIMHVERAVRSVTVHQIETKECVRVWAHIVVL
jgi:hypothetical protein